MYMVTSSYPYQEIHGTFASELKAGGGLTVRDATVRLLRYRNTSAVYGTLQCWAVEVTGVLVYEASEERSREVDWRGGEDEDTGTVQEERSWLLATPKWHP